MSNCLCLACDRPNSITTKFCTQCGAKLQIQDRYRALKAIGQGGFGKTFLAQDESKPSQPRCVIKQFAFETINPNASQGTLDVAIRLFEQEAKRLDDLGKHPQIPELLSFTIHEGKQYLIQEFIDGETLEQELGRVGAFSEQQVRDVLVEVLQILEFVHSKSVIHRDISPDNIIRRRSDKKLVLVDFGAAKHATATLLAKTGTGIGKPSYGAPEQMLGKSVFQSDLFGLGVTCLHLLTNVEPFTLYDVLENEYQWRQFLNGKVVSDGFGKLLDRLTAYRVKERPSSVIETLQVLQPKAAPVKLVPLPVVPSQQAKPSSLSGIFSQPVQTPISASSNSFELDCGNGVKLELVKVAGGSFKMGSDNLNSERPVHQVTLNDFLIGKYPITQQQWQSIIGSNPSHFKGLNLPVEQVSCNDAQKFCKILSSRMSRNVRLPTESEWEYAAKGGNQSKGYLYSGSNNFDEIGWYKNNAESSTHPMGQKKPNELGIYDMSGNVWELCLDEWHDHYLFKPEKLKRNGNEAWGEWSHNKSCVLRGGSWFDEVCRLTCRNGGNVNIKGNRYGFRIIII
ncbi:bifunctional serine/threonine-protein kinase/formylglycine-generating enzyme family protein [Pseudanabaena sp. 'Roaring Creek']|uniref:bifunctional serine/threonine-protein kinase/formylglycine-generating enzyme family protein n=1 Tax=Pseudanabaena sp. 'Roaring Creek' TaxID=1681830 RepID=UPI0006D83592|nr:bifunctional serine/threonine-protein kinase/formylglycine-generating enzyme family protein [Pseudanabaena sp. 'Roaring Creek']